MPDVRSMCAIGMRGQIGLNGRPVDCICARGHKRPNDLDGAGGAALFDVPYTVTAQEVQTAAGLSDSPSVSPSVAAAQSARSAPAVSALPVEVSGGKSLAGVWWQPGDFREPTRLSVPLLAMSSALLQNSAGICCL